MARLLTLLMMIVLVAANGSAVAGAMCHHRDAREHSIARQSRDAKVSASALTEEAAAAIASKNGTVGSSASLALPAYILPQANLPFAPRDVEPMRRPQVDATPLSSRSIRPLLEPPVA
jgi:hypothetical protein